MCIYVYICVCVCVCVCTYMYVVVTQGAWDSPFPRRSASPPNAVSSPCPKQVLPENADTISHSFDIVEKYASEGLVNRTHSTVQISYLSVPLGTLITRMQAVLQYWT